MPTSCWSPRMKAASRISDSVSIRFGTRSRGKKTPTSISFDLLLPRPQTRNEALQVPEEALRERECAVGAVTGIGVTNDFGLRVAIREARLMALQQRGPEPGIGLNNLDRAQKFSPRWDRRKDSGDPSIISPAATVLSLYCRSNAQ
jgi:hypothetical protein